MFTTGLRELRQNASDIVRRVEGGETAVVTVSGREVAQLCPIHRRQWRAGADVQSIFAGPGDEQWAADRAAIDDSVVDPFE
jgi:prevent-host-death family protein